MTRLLRPRTLLFMTTAVLLACLAALTSMDENARSQTPGPSEKARHIASGPDLSFDPSLGYFRTTDEIRARAAAVIESVPFPPDRNSARELPWDRQGELAEGDVQLLVQANAMC